MKTTTNYEHQDQRAALANCDWILYPTLTELEEFQPGLDPGGAFCGVYFKRELNHHGFRRYHQAITADYYAAVKAMRVAGVTNEQWRRVRGAVRPSPMSQRTMERGAA